MEEKESAISGPYEEFRICFCGKIPSGSVEWYFIDVSVEEACLSEKTESSTRKLTRFSVSEHLLYLGDHVSVGEHLSSCAALGGLIYSLGGHRRSLGGGDTLLNDVWLLDFKSLEDLKLVPGRKPQLQKSRKPRLQKSPTVLSHDEALEQKLSSEDLPGAGFPFKSRTQKLSHAELHDLWERRERVEIFLRYWRRGLSMNFARYNPHTMVVDHKLYVLGGFLPNQNQADGWIEVFDPEENKWESLPSPPDEFQIHSSIMISGLLKSKKEIIIAKQRWDCHPLLFYSYNITTRCWNELSLPSDSKASVHSDVERAVILPPNIGRAVTVGNTLYWISTEEHNDRCTLRAYDLDRNMWFEDHLNTATIFGRREDFSSIYSRGPGFLHLVDQKFCLLLQSTVTKDPQSSIEYLYCVILDISPIYEHEHEDWGKFELTTVSVQKYSMDHYIDFLDCMLLDRVSGVNSVDRSGQSTRDCYFLKEIEELRNLYMVHSSFKENDQVG